MAAIRSVGLTKQYGERVVVDNLDIEVEAGEVFGFLGPNGSGKTTTTRMLLGLVRPDEGAAWILDAKLPCPQKWSNVGALVEEPAFYGWMTGRQNLQVIAKEGAPVGSGAVDRALGEAGIASAGDRKVRTYSQGMRQRLGLAAAVLRRPSVVFLDEPSNGLDPSGIHDLRELLRRLADSGSTVFLSSHLLGEVEQVCDRIGIIDRGRLLSVGTMAGLLGAAKRAVIRIQPQEMAAARIALSDWSITDVGDSKLTVIDATGGEANRALASVGIYASSIIEQHLTLEEWFLSVTEGEHHRAATAS